MSKADERLERKLGLGAALAIGVGTMIGAGLFVLPGIAAGKAGPAATISFAIGGGVALLVAACTAELATQMPRSGGPYHYVYEVFGDFGGFIVGSCQVAGLMFASAFYLVAFARYFIDVLGEFGLSLGDPIVLIASGAALLLTAINIAGAGSAAKLQDALVMSLATILVLLFGYGLLDVTGLVGERHTAGEFAPNGGFAVLNTAALVFVSYLGFAQIATVAGEIERPSRNLPIALLGSVALVSGLYMLTLFVATRVISYAELGQLGEIGTAEVARRLIGNIGGTIVMLSGVLAALSSANASILSGSRTLFAMGKNDLAPKFTSHVNARFETPHIALAFIGIPTIALVFLDNLEPLAETASALHLFIYGALCATLIAYRRQRRKQARDSFRLPFGNIVAGAGILACAGLLFVMPAHANVAVLGILMFAAATFAIRSRIRKTR